MSEMSAAEAATVARFDAAEPAPESWRGDGLREALAEALWTLTGGAGGRIADAVLALPEVAALRAEAAAADRVRELAEDLESYVAARGRPATGTYDDGLNRAQASVAADLRAALDGPAPC